MDISEIRERGKRISGLESKIEKLEQQVQFISGVMVKMLEREAKRHPGEIVDDLSLPAIMPDPEKTEI